MFTEIFSFAEMPWSGVAELDVMKRLQGLEKLRRPDQCPLKIYELMLECWRLDVERRVTSDRITVEVNGFIADPANQVGDVSLIIWPKMMTVDEREATLVPLHQSFSINLQSDEVDRMIDQLEVSVEQIEVEKQLGQGQFGTVNLAVFHRLDGNESKVAVKTLNASVPATERSQFAYEARLLASLKHKNIVRLIAVCFKHQPNMIVLELMSGGDLKSYLRTRQEEISGMADELLLVCIEIADAMAYLERSHVVHRDLAAR